MLLTDLLIAKPFGFDFALAAISLSSFCSLSHPNPTCLRRANMPKKRDEKIRRGRQAFRTPAAQPSPALFSFALRVFGANFEIRQVESTEPHEVAALGRSCTFGLCNLGHDFRGYS